LLLNQEEMVDFDSSFDGSSVLLCRVQVRLAGADLTYGFSGLAAGIDGAAPAAIASRWPS
jgi:hypothetical protein